MMPLRLKPVRGWQLLGLAASLAAMPPLLSAPGAAQQPSSPPIFAPLVTEPAADLTEPTPTRYTLGPGDQVTITVIGYEEFNGTQVVLPDGTIALPLIGDVQAAGQTTATLSAALTSQLQVYLVNPAVSVGLAALRPVMVSVGGEVYRPGPVQLSSLTSVDDDITPLTLSAALRAAGGVTRTADLRQVTVRRSTTNGEVDTFTVNLWETLLSERTLSSLTLRDGDAIHVPTVVAVGEIDPRLVASSSLAPDAIRVRVIGEVNRPGEIQLPPDSSVSGAIAVAGGPTEDAQLSEVALIRLNEQGQIEEQRLDVNNLVNPKQIQEGDVLVVAKRGYLSVLDSIGRVVQGIFPPFTLLNFFQ